MPGVRLCQSFLARKMRKRKPSEPGNKKNGISEALFHVFIYFKSNLQLALH